MASKKAAEKTYRPKGYGISPSLARARAPFRMQNAITGVTLFGFAISVWAYSINAVKQDNFDDIDFEALNTSVEEKAKRISLEDEAKSRQSTAAFAAVPETQTSVATTTRAPIMLSTTIPDKRGLLARYSGSTSLLLPGESSIVSEAPSLDKLGRWGDRYGKE
ncbi:hypothetical protein FRB99_006284 [Tulasnella sp. 403]|nr:hypothetical protein FRB99_006284 [Tulasnella sp. 403]